MQHRFPFPVVGDTAAGQKAKAATDQHSGHRRSFDIGFGYPALQGNSHYLHRGALRAQMKAAQISPKNLAGRMLGLGVRGVLARNHMIVNDAFQRGTRNPERFSNGKRETGNGEPKSR